MKKLLIVGILSALLVLTGCQSSGSSQGQSATSSQSKTSQSSSSATTTKSFTLAQLKKFNGKNGNTAYVAVSGVVYDVSNAKDWSNGEHKGGATAGNDLTQLIQDSPHGTSVLSKLPVVGKLTN